MAKTSKIIRNEQRKELVAKYADKRAELKAELQELFKDHQENQQKIQETYRRLRALPRESSPTRVRNRCALTGRPRGYVRKFGLSRIAMRELAHKGELPGVVKSSW